MAGLLDSRPGQFCLLLSVEILSEYWMTRCVIVRPVFRRICFVSNRSCVVRLTNPAVVSWLLDQYDYVTSPRGGGREVLPRMSVVIASRDRCVM